MKRCRECEYYAKNIAPYTDQLKWNCNRKSLTGSPLWMIDESQGEAGWAERCPEYKLVITPLYLVAKRYNNE